MIDSGVAWDQPDLQGRIFYNRNETPLGTVDADNNGCVADIVGCNFVSLNTADPSCGYTTAPPNWPTNDDEGHGTFVAGLPAAAPGAGLGGLLALVAAEQPDARAQEHGEECAQARQAQHVAGAQQDAAEHVASQVVGAKPVAGRRRLPGILHDLLVGAIGRKQRAEESRQEKQRRDGDAQGRGGPGIELSLIHI